MILRVVLVFAFFMCVAKADAQLKSQVFEKNTSITFFGLDFTGAKFIGDAENFMDSEKVYELMRSWNKLMFAEPDKFDVAAAIEKKRVENAFDITDDHNRELKIPDLVSSSPKDFFHLSPAIIHDIVSGYDFKGKEGIGLMFNIESFSKLNESGVLWFTFVDLKSKKVVFTERMSGEPGGLGIRNYWANSVYDILKKVEKKEFSIWRKKYYRTN